MNIRRPILVLGLCVTGLLLATAAFTLLQAQPNDETPESLADAITLSNEAEASSISASGQLQADQVASLSFLMSGQVAEVGITEGQRVSAGQGLVRLENQQQYLAFEQANLSYGLSLLQYQDLQTVDDNDVRIAQAAVTSAQSSYSAVANAVTDEDIAAADLEYQQALIALDGVQRARRVADPGVLDNEGIALLDAQIGEASFNAEMARLRLEDLKTANRGNLGAAGAQINQARAALDQVMAGPSSYQLDQAQTAIDQAVVAVDQAELVYNRTLLTAPFEGIVTSIQVEDGQRVSAGTPVLQLVDIEPLTLDTEVNEVDIEQVYEGMAAQVYVDALPGLSFDGVVTSIASRSRNSGGIVVYDVDIQVNSNDARLRPGMSADADLIASD